MAKVGIQTAEEHKRVNQILSLVSTLSIIKIWLGSDPIHLITSSSSRLDLHNATTKKLRVQMTTMTIRVPKPCIKVCKVWLSCRLSSGAYERGNESLRWWKLRGRIMNLMWKISKSVANLAEGYLHQSRSTRHPTRFCSPYHIGQMRSPGLPVIGSAARIRPTLRVL